MSRQSLYPSADQTASTAAQKRLKEKEREFQAYQIIQQHSTKLVSTFDSFKEQMEVLGNGSSSVAIIMEQWKSVFRATHVALASLESQKVPSLEDETVLELPSNAKLDVMVRIPIKRKE